MMARVRKIKDGEILLYNQSKFKLNKCFPWTYKEVKAGLLYNNELKQDKQYIETEDATMIKFEVNSYSNNYIFNKVEDLNKQKYIFLLVFKQIALRKGYIFIIQPKETIPTETPQEAPQEAQQEAPREKVNIINENIINAIDINETRYIELLDKQKRSIATTEDKYIIKKHYYKKITGLDILDTKILSKFKYSNVISNFLFLIDEGNKTKGTKLKHDELSTKRQYVLNIIDKLGFAMHDIFKINDVKNKIKYDMFENNMMTAIKYLVDEHKTNKRFNMIMNESKHNINKMKDATLKAQLGYLNSILSSYALKISSTQHREKGTKKAEFIIILLIYLIT